MYSDDCLQYYVDPWWVKKPTGKAPEAGRVIWTFLQHVDVRPQTLTPTGRASPTNHQLITYRLSALSAQAPMRQTPELPIAALPNYPNEVYTVHRSKKRPAVVVASGWPGVPRNLLQQFPKWPAVPTMLVAPMYGTTSGSRAGWSPAFVARIKACEYPQYMWEFPPLKNPPEPSVVRFDHIQPVSIDSDAYVTTEFCLSEEAMEVVSQWLRWLIGGEVPEGGTLGLVRDEFRKQPA